MRFIINMYLAVLSFTCYLMCHDLRVQKTWSRPVCLQKAENIVLQMCTGCNSHWSCIQTITNNSSLLLLLIEIEPYWFGPQVCLWIMIALTYMWKNVTCHIASASASAVSCHPLWWQHRALALPVKSSTCRMRWENWLLELIQKGFLNKMHAPTDNTYAQLFF